jgi:parvulin-like peptidyl-prolyl isomerase
MKTRLIALFVAALAALAACGDDAGGGLTANAAAAVGGKKITVDEVDDALATFEKTGQYDQLTSQQEPSAVRRQFQQGYLSQIVRRYVLDKEAEERDLEVSSSEISDALDQIKADFPSEEEFQKAVDQQGLTDDQLQGLVRDQIIEDKLRQEISADLQPDADELQSFYDKNAANYQETRASHILVAKEGLASDLATQLQNAKSGALDGLFAKLAKKSSDDPGSAKKGGDLGFFAPGDLVPEFQEAADKLDVGEVSGPVQSQFGFHIIRVTDRRVKPFEEVRDQIAQELSGAEQEQEFQKFIKQAYEDADVRVNPRYGELDLETQRVVDATAEDVPGAEVPEETPGTEGGEGEPPASPPADE